MTFPVIGGQSGGGAATGTSTVGANLPDIIVSGDLLVAQVMCNIASATIADAANGWTSALTLTGATTSTEVLYKIAAGADALSIARGSSCELAYSVIRITAASWHGTTPPEAAGQSFAVASQPDAPNLTPSWGAEDTLFCVGLGWRSTGAQTTVFPTNYDTNERVLTGANGNGSFGRSLLGFRELNATSDNPAAWNNGSAGGHGITIAIRPKAGTPDVEKKFYLVNAVPAGATLHRTLQERGTLPTVAQTTTGWVVGNKAVGQCCIQNGGSEVALGDGQWGATTQPNAGPSQTIGDCWRSENTYTGTFADGPWYFLFVMRSVTAAYTGRCRLRLRVWRATDANGTSAVELSSGSFATNIQVGNMGTAINTQFATSWSPGSTLSLSGEYLFFNVGVEVTTQGGGATQDANHIVGPSTASSFFAYMLTPTFGAAAAFSAAWANSANTIIQPGAVQA